MHESRRKRKLAASAAAKKGTEVPGGLSDLKIGVLGCMAERLKVRASESLGGFLCCHMSHSCGVNGCYLGGIVGSS